MELARVTDALRTRVQPDGQLLVLPDTAPFKVIRKDVSGITSPSELEACLRGMRDHAAQESQGPEAPACMVELFQLSDTETRCLYCFDLRVFDLPSIEFVALRCRRIYEGTYKQLNPVHIADYRRTEDAWLASADGQAARRHWERRLPITPGRIKATDLVKAPRKGGYGYHCTNIRRETWSDGQRIAADLGVNAFTAVQTLFTELLAHLSGRDAFAYETRSFQRLPFHRDVYELLGQFTLGSLAVRDASAPVAFVERVRAEQDRTDRSAPFVFYDAASHWQMGDDSGGKIVFTNTCNRFEEFVLAGNVPPMRWFGDYLRIEQHTPDTALEYVLVENADDLESHWFVNNADLPHTWAERAQRQLCTALNRLCLTPELWQSSNIFAEMEHLP